MQKNTEKVPKKCCQRGPKIHQKSMKIGPCSQMAPQGHPGMPLGTPGPPKWSPGTSKVTIWDIKSYNFTLISNHFLYQNSKKCRSFPLFLIDFENSFGRQSTSQMRDEALYWDIPHPTSDGQCTLYDGGSKIRGASIFRNMTSNFLIPFLFFVCSFCFAAVQKTQLSSQLSPYGQYIYAKRVFCASFKRNCHDASSITRVVSIESTCNMPQYRVHPQSWVAQETTESSTRNHAQETTLIKWSQTLPLKQIATTHHQ